MMTREHSFPRLLTREAYENLPTIPADHRLFYGPEPAQFGDLYLPQQPGPHPVIIFFHGGSWRAHWASPLRTAVYGVHPRGPRRVEYGISPVRQWGRLAHDLCGCRDRRRLLAEHRRPMRAGPLSTWWLWGIRRGGI